MPAIITPQEFVARWRGVTLTEKSSSQSHFIDLCQLLGQQTPVEADPTGDWYTFERGAEKTTGRNGWADVWKRGFFGWEYKGPKKDLAAAYNQLLQYAGSLENPPLLVVSDIQTIIVHSNFTNTIKRVETFTLDDLLDPAKLDLLRAVWTDPERYRPPVTVDVVTEQAAQQFAKLADTLRDQGEDPRRAAHYLIRLLFCLFSEDVGLLPNSAFTRLVESAKNDPADFTLGIRQLFSAMASGGRFGIERIPHFNGRLFDDEDAPPLSRNGLATLSRVAGLDWGSVAPAIFGTLFERSLDPSKRAQLGAHYTPRSDIELIVEPVLMAPLRRRWEEVKAEASAAAAKRDGATAVQRAKIDSQLSTMVLTFMEELASIRVLDPACGSGNFLYVSLLLLLDLWKEVWLYMEELGLQRPFALDGICPSPMQLHGIEINEYAHELAQVTIWIGYIQWLRDNGFGRPAEPILKPIDTIEQRDAILAYDSEGKPVEPEWPEAEVVVGNPPFLGTKKLRGQLGDGYVEDVFRLYGDRIPNFSDLACYWFEKGREQIVSGGAKRVGLLATNSIRGGENRRVLERIKATGDIFMAWSDRDWVLDGAAVRVSMIGFDDGSDYARSLDGRPVPHINSDLTGGMNITTARRLAESAKLAYIGDVKVGAFDIDAAKAAAMLTAPLNTNSRPNSDVVRPWVNSLDVTRRPRDMWIVDFGADMSQDDAALYELPFEHVVENVYPIRSLNRKPPYARRWWLHAEPCRGMRQAVEPLRRFICTPTVAKHRVFVWMTHPTLPDHQLVVIARDDDYFFGALHSRPHELWALRLGTSLEDRPRYTPTTTFETFPFPWPPGGEPTDDPRVLAIAEAARELVELRDRWLNPDGASEAELKKRTLTNLYNERGTGKEPWLDLAHRKLDEAVFAAYGWPADLSDDEVLERLLALNLERAGAA